MKKKDQFAAILKAAREYLRQNYFIVPIPAGKYHPTSKGWQKLRLTAKNYKKFFANAAGIGLLLKPSKLTDIDCDCLESVAAADVLLPKTEMIHGRAGNPRSHRYFISVPTPENRSFSDPRIKKDNSRRAMLIEFRTNGQTVAPPSCHLRSGERIRWEPGGKPAQCDGAELLKTVAQIAAAAVLGRYWPRGSRHRAALALAGMLMRANWSVQATERFVRAVASAAHDEEMESRLHDVLSTAERLEGGKNATGSPTLAELIGEDIVACIREWLELKSSIETICADDAVHFSDLGNARRLVARHGKDLRYCHASKDWFIWNGARWAGDKKGGVEVLAKETILALYPEATETADRLVRETIVNHALKSEAEARFRAMIALAKSEPGIPIAPDEFDSDSWVLSLLNGTLDLRTGKLLPHRREFFCTKQAPVEFDPNAPCPTWNAFLDRIMGGNSSLIGFLQRAIGYALTGLTTEQVLFFLYGTGANGKTTFLETIRGLLGDYATPSDFSTFLATKNEDRPRNDLARLKAARFVSAVEAGEGRRLAEPVVKQLTGSDTIVARFLFHEFFEFVPQFKLFLAANHKPRIVGTDPAIWRRIRLVPFAVAIPESEQDKHLQEKLQVELAGILNWALRGCLEWQRCGLGESPEVATATACYRREMDIFADFLDERCVIGPDEWATSADIYIDYQSWCERNGERPLAKNAFGTKLRERGFEDEKHNGARCWFGIGLPKKRSENWAEESRNPSQQNSPPECSEADPAATDDWEYAFTPDEIEDT
jgi:P4 family phage/plasmid primase-like protien